MFLPVNYLSEVVKTKTSQILACVSFHYYYHALLQFDSTLMFYRKCFCYFSTTTKKSMLFLNDFSGGSPTWSIKHPELIKWMTLKPNTRLIQLRLLGNVVSSVYSGQLSRNNQQTTLCCFIRCRSFMLIQASLLSIYKQYANI